MNSEYKLFVRQCIKNRKYLEFSYQDMSDCLLNVSPDNYEDFECGNYSMSKENLIRIARVLCVKKPSSIDIKDYIDTSGMSEEETKDLSRALNAIVGDDNA